MIILYNKYESFNHVSWGTAMNCSAIFKGSKDAYGVVNIKDVCSTGVHVETSVYSTEVYLVGIWGS